ncbi:ExbD/TolR family protein [Thiohalomonas denitrificans]|uniref:Biopolymer transport protein ExbD n=1 Tax=Thiohalomonas denitrificans TaxID=415747 RepID=A0A1G5QS23_9GAMM|nr:biopolymer transporter ExbD [Thiohalomonas denitrificans]SCZ64633.1 Biopolymer transport protein ExbD [Thiohalomonas denitrificans]
MGRRHHYRRKKETPELDVTTFLNLMVVLIPFLLITAVFSRITIQELNMPESAGGGEVDKPLVTIEVIVRENAIEIGDGKSVTLSIPKVDGAHDIEKLSEFLMKLKAKYEDKEDAIVLVEPDIPYEDMIHVMDAVKVAEITEEDEEEIQKLVLFPEISIGDAP